MGVLAGGLIPDPCGPGGLAEVEHDISTAQASCKCPNRDEAIFSGPPGEVPLEQSDEFIAHPMVQWTRGVTVHAVPEPVWSWLAQMGYGRGGWYTPQWGTWLPTGGCLASGARSGSARPGCCRNISMLLLAT
jgi:hypothetical protein